MSQVLSYDQFLNEALLVVKRKYTDLHPEKKVSNYAPVRERVLSFIKEKGSVSEKELQEFLRMMNEETGRKTTMGWVKANDKFFTVKNNEGEKMYSLSKDGHRVHDKLTSIK
jgi:hypothetical protein